MLARACRAAAEHSIANVSWLLGADVNMPALAALLGARRTDAITIGQALNWMNYRELFPALAALLRSAAGVGVRVDVITNGTPLWLHDTAWSHALRTFLEQWLDTTLISATSSPAAVMPCCHTQPSASWP